MRGGRWTRVAAAVAVAATAAVTAGCGGGSNSALSLDPVAAAATKTQAAGAARIRFSLAVSSPQLPSGKMLHLEGSGAIDGTSAEMTFDMGAIARQMGGMVPKTAMAQLAHSSMREILLRQDGDYVMYMQLGALASRLPGGKQWVELDLSKLGKSAGVDLGKLLSGSQLQPGDLFGMLKAEGATIHKVGPDTIDGIATTHYRVTVDVAKALQAKGLTTPLLGGMAAQMPKLPEDVWVGKDGLVHRVALSYSLAQAGMPARLAMTMDLYDYGADVSIAAPPSSEVFDATDLARQGLGGALPH